MNKEQVDLAMMVVESTAVCCPDSTILEKFGIDGLEIDRSLLPAALKRRTSLTTRMAITAADAACRNADQSGENLAAVFASVGGEIQITDVLCRDLSDMNALLSPTQFHNSVHNTTAGYWSIIKGCQAPITAIAACEDTLAMGLLEAWSQLQQGAERVLLVCYDEEWPQYLAPPMGEVAFACALVLSANQPGTQGRKITKPYIESNICPPENIDPELLALVKSAPAAVIIPLLEALDDEQSNDAPIPLTLGDTLRWRCRLP